MLAQAPTLQWATVFNGFGNSRAYAIAPTDGGEVYTTGNFQGTADFDPGTGTYNISALDSYGDAFVSKQDDAGNLLWAISIAGPGYQSGNGIAVGTSGHVYVAGIFSDSADFDPGLGTHMMTSSGPNISNSYVAKFTPSGQLVWAVKFDGSATNHAYTIALDTAENVHITGQLTDTMDADPGAGIDYLTDTGWGGQFIIQLDSAGNYNWGISAGNGGPNEITYGLSIDTDDMGYVYTSGAFGGTVDFDPSAGVASQTAVGYRDVFVSKYDALGNYIWVKTMGGTDIEEAYNVAVDDDGNVYSSGYFNLSGDFDPGAGVHTLTSNGAYDVFVSKLDAAGNFLWAKNIGGGSFDGCYGMALTDAGVYTIGHLIGTGDFDPGPGTFNLTATINGTFISLLDPAGNFGWAGLMGASASYYGVLGSNHAQSIYAAGDFAGTGDFDPGTGTLNLTANDSNDVYVLRLDESTINGIAPANMASNVLAYPNPTTGLLYLNGINQPFTATVYNAVGESVMHIKNTSFINLNNQAPGIYVLALQVGDTVIRRKVVVK